MSVTQYLKEKVKRGTVHITMIDPMKQSPEAAARLALTAQEVGSDLILIAGLSGLSQRNLLKLPGLLRKKYPYLWFILHQVPRHSVFLLMPCFLAAFLTPKIPIIYAAGRCRLRLF